MKCVSRLSQALTCVLLLSLATLTQASSKSPNLVISQQDITEMRAAIQQEGRFKQAFNALQTHIDSQLKRAIDVPVPKDGGGGYTHEQHKRNYQLMYDAALVYQITQQQKYADFVRDMFLEYAQLYPTLPLHPARKTRSQNPGKLFWQSLNEAVWLVYSIQAYDLMQDSLNSQQAEIIENKLLKPVALFLSGGQPSTFNKVHNHGTWATAGVGMAGFVFNEDTWVDKALLDLDLSGEGGFLRQLDELFSPQGYYNEGPYYQRYALMPFVTFAKAIDNNQPQRKIFEYRDSVLLKAIDTTIQLSYAGLFFPINDAIKSKGIDTIELVHAVAIAYGLNADRELLDIAGKQNQIVISGDGLKLARALDNDKQLPYEFDSVAFGDGAQGDEGALVVMRSTASTQPALLFKPAAQGLGHGHFDKLTWQFYHMGEEIVSDYGAARFLNVEAKFGGRYLPENSTYAKQTIAHNTVVVDETSHFDADVNIGNRNHPELVFFEHSERGSVARGKINTAYPDVLLDRTIALVELPDANDALAIDIFDVESAAKHQFDLPVHYHGQLISTDFSLEVNSSVLSALGDKNGYQHLWNKGTGVPSSNTAQVTWLNDNGKFYTHTSVNASQERFIFTQLGANDPNFNLRNENAFIRRVTDAQSHTFISILEPHGDYNPSKEYTLDAVSKISTASFAQQGSLLLLEISYAKQAFLVVIDKREQELTADQQTFEYKGQNYQLRGRLAWFELNSN